MHTRRTLSLNHKTWDIEIDDLGLIKITEGAMATAQNVANEARLFTKDAYFIQDRGIPYFATTLGHRTNDVVLRAYLRQAALSVPDVAEVLDITVTSFDKTTRKLSGDIRFRTLGDSDNGEIRSNF